MDETVLDSLVRAIEAAPEDDDAKRLFFARFAESELHLLLDTSPDNGAVTPTVLELSAGRMILVFDRIERLAAYLGGPQPYVSLSGRALVEMLKDQGLGVALNPDVGAPYFLSAAAVSWLAEATSDGPSVVPARIVSVMPPKEMPEVLLRAIDARLATTGGLATSAYLVGVVYDTGLEGHMLGFVDAIDGAQSSLARTINEALQFSGVSEGALDVGFFSKDQAIVNSLASQGLKFDLPQPRSATSNAVSGRDPNRPPRLR